MPKKTEGHKEKAKKAAEPKAKENTEQTVESVAVPEVPQAAPVTETPVDLGSAGETPISSETVTPEASASASASSVVQPDSQASPETTPGVVQPGPVLPETPAAPGPVTPPGQTPPPTGTVPLGEETPPPASSSPFDPSLMGDDGGDKKKWFLIIGGFTLVLLLIAGGIYAYFTYFAKGMPAHKASNTSTTVPTKAPTPTPETVDKSAYEVKVLNGSGTAGVASSTQSSLEDDGFTVGDTGNADNYDYTETVIQAKSDVPEEFLKELRTTLEKSYKVASDVEDLEDSSEDNVIVIVGSEKAE